jgi:hypothetical protein
MDEQENLMGYISESGQLEDQEGDEMIILR